MGLGDTDPHVVFFWNSLEALSAEELRMFIRFACNQARLPALVDPNVEVPPYPMKIAAPVSNTGEIL